MLELTLTEKQFPGLVDICDDKYRTKKQMLKKKKKKTGNGRNSNIELKIRFNVY